MHRAVAAYASRAAEKLRRHRVVAVQGFTLTTTGEIETWLTAPWSEAKALQHPLPDPMLRIVAKGQKQDG